METKPGRLEHLFENCRRKSSRVLWIVFLTAPLLVSCRASSADSLDTAEALRQVGKSHVMGALEIRLPLGWRRLDPTEEKRAEGYVFRDDFMRLGKDSDATQVHITFEPESFSNPEHLQDSLRRLVDMWRRDDPGLKVDWITIRGVKGPRQRSFDAKEDATYFIVMVPVELFVYPVTIRIPGTAKEWPAGVNAFLSSLSPRGARSTRTAAGRLTDAITSAASLRELAATDPRDAFERYADPGVTRYLSEIGNLVWPLTDPALGWSFFFRYSLMTPGAEVNGQTPIAFYHPWSDVFLITFWRETTGLPRLSDAEFLMGSFVRQKGQPKFRAIAPWREDLRSPAMAAGSETARQLIRFEASYAVSKRWDGAGRDILPGMRDARVMEENHIGAGIQLMQTVSDLVSYRENPLLRSDVQSLLRSWGTPEFEKMLADLRGLSDLMRARLNLVPPEVALNLRPVSFLTAGGKALVFLGNELNPDLYMSVLLSTGDKARRLERIEVLNFQGFYAPALREMSGELGL